MAVQVEIRDDLALISMDDGKANALNGPLLDELHQALEQGVRHKAIILTGRPGYFSGGLDLKQLPGLEATALERVVERFVAVVMKLWESPVPVVAAVSGHAIAGGCVLLLTSDYALGMEGPFRVGLNETAIGIPMPAILVEMARSRLDPRFLQRAVLHGEIFRIEQARDIGYLDEMCPVAGLKSRALEVARRLAKIPPQAYQTTKRNLRALSHRPTELKAAVHEFFASFPGR